MTSNSAGDIGTVTTVADHDKDPLRFRPPRWYMVMEIDREQLYGVVTGDVVDSSKLESAERELLFEVMQRGSQELQSWLGAKMPLEVDIYGGDTWQVLLTDPGKSLAAGLFFRAFLRSHSPHCDSRFVAAVGPVDFVPRNKVSEGDGQAFRLSGQMLVELKKRRMGFAAHDPSATARWDIVFELVDALAIKWSEKQALAVSGALRDWTQEEIGKLWETPIQQATVNRRLRSASWQAVSRASIEFQDYWASHEYYSA